MSRSTRSVGSCRSRWAAMRMAIVTTTALFCVGGASTAVPATTPTASPTPVFPPCDFEPAPSFGVPGTIVDLSGRCYPIHSGRLGRIYFDDVLIAQVRGDTPGSYAVRFTIAADTAPGVHSFRISGSGSEVPIRTAVFSVIVPYNTCGGDCNADEVVTIDELLMGVNIALGARAPGECPTLDADSSGAVTVDELLGGVRVALDGCPPSNSCHTGQDCGGRCLEPGGFIGCGSWRELNDECERDSDCQGGLDSFICALGGPELCARSPVNVCVPGCTADGGCAPDEICAASQRCVPRSCVGHTCPRHFLCEPSFPADVLCERRHCGNDVGCLGGFCVNGLCYEHLGTCTPPPP